MQNVALSFMEAWLKEDGVGEGGSYWQSLPVTPVRAEIKIKSDLTLAGLAWFGAVFEKLSPGLGAKLRPLLEYEGKDVKAGTIIVLPTSLPWGVAITGERLALNLLHRASAIATTTKALVSLTQPAGIKVLDTRKTTPGLRELEKYAVTVGGGHNHRFTQTDVWMIKDNHKELMGLEGSIRFFRDLKHPYKNLIVEIHSLDELTRARALGIKHFMLDNFTPEMLQQACVSKVAGDFYEVSGGINLSTVKSFLIAGVDAVSSGAITQSPAPVDISFKFRAEST